MDVSMEVPIDDRDWIERRSVFIFPQKQCPVHQLKKHTRAFIMSPAREIMSMLNATSNGKLYKVGIGSNVTKIHF